MSTRPAVKPFLLRRGAAIIASVLAAGTLATFAGVAGAAPQPTVDEVQKAVNQLTTQMDQAVQHYDQGAQELASANQRLALVNREVSTDRASFQSMRAQVAAIASTAYENGNMSSLGALLTTNNPQAVMSQASVLMQLSTDRSAQVAQFISAASQLEGAQQIARRTQRAVAALDKQLLVRKQSIGTALDKKKALLATLTAQQTPPATVGAGGTTSAVYTGTTSTQAGQGGRVRLRPARQALRMGCHRPRFLRLLGARPSRLGIGRGRHPARYLLTGGGAPSDTTVQPSARRPGLLRRRWACGHVRGQQHAHRRPATRPERRADQPVLTLVLLHRQQRRPALTRGSRFHLPD